MTILELPLTSWFISDIYKIFDFLIQKTIQPYIQMLGKWIYFGILDDIYDEFFVEEKIKESFNNKNDGEVTEDFWQDKYILHKNKVPVFLEQLAQKIFLTGKYVNVIRSYNPEQKLNTKITLLDNYVFTLYNEDLRLAIDSAYKWANTELTNIIFNREGLISRLNSLKHYFFLDTGDLFLQLMDLADLEFRKNCRNASLSRLQNFLDIALRSSMVNTDPFKESVSCSLSRFSTFEIFQAFQNYKGLKKYTKKEFEDKYGFGSNFESKKVYETFDIEYKLGFPLNLIVSKAVVLRYQILFRYLFTLKFAERELNGAWLVFQQHRDLNNNSFIRLASALIQRMLHFCKTLIYHFAYEVVEKNWNILMQQLKKKVNVFEDIINFQESFLKSCFNETLLFDKNFKELVWKVVMFFIFASDKTKGFLNDYFALDYKSLIVGLLD